MPRDATTDIPLCTNGTCGRDQVEDCTNLFCRQCCDEKCDGVCGRAVAERIEPQDVPQF